MDETSTGTDQLTPVQLLLTGSGLDAAFVLISGWMVAGVTWDFGVHMSGISFAEEGFVTAPHVTFYAAVGALAILLIGATLRNRQDGTSWWAAIPPGYRWGVVGVGLFAVAGPMDYLWHTAFGFEEGIEGLTSPTHLTLATGAVLFLASPLRAAWHRETPTVLRKQLPLLASAAFVAISIGAFAMYGNPIADPAGTESFNPAHGVLAIVAFSVLYTGMGLVLADQFDLAFGAFTFLYPLATLPFTGSEEFVLFPAMVVTGLAVDSFNRWFAPGRSRPLVLRAFGAWIPLMLYGTYFLSIRLTWGLPWSTHIWAGALFGAVLVGILTSYLVVPFGGDPE